MNLLREYDDHLDIILRNNVWVKVEVLSRMTSLSRREIRHISHDRGYATGNKGLARWENLSPEETKSAHSRTVSTFKSYLERYKKERDWIKWAGTMQLPDMEEI